MISSQYDISSVTVEWKKKIYWELGSYIARCLEIDKNSCENIYLTVQEGTWSEKSVARSW